MGSFRVKIEVGDLSGRRFEEVEALVDTGSTYTRVPQDLLDRLGVQPQEDRPFVLADGRKVAYGVAWIEVRIDGRAQPTIAVFGDPGSETLLGVVTLEEFLLAADPVSRRLVPVPGLLKRARRQRRNSLERMGARSPAQKMGLVSSARMNRLWRSKTAERWTRSRKSGFRYARMR